MEAMEVPVQIGPTIDQVVEEAVDPLTVVIHDLTVPIEEIQEKKYYGLKSRW